MVSKKVQAAVCNGLRLNVTLDHKRVAECVLERLQAMPRQGESASEADIYWKVLSRLIRHDLQPWQIFLLLDLLPASGEVVDWAHDADTLSARLKGCFQKAVRDHAAVLVADATKTWLIYVEPVDLPGHLMPVAHYSVELVSREDAQDRTRDDD